jgi:hypothetical protein
MATQSQGLKPVGERMGPSMPGGKEGTVRTPSVGRLDRMGPCGCNRVRRVKRSRCSAWQLAPGGVPPLLVPVTQAPHNNGPF